MFPIMPLRGAGSLADVCISIPSDIDWGECSFLLSLSLALSLSLSLSACVQCVVIGLQSTGEARTREVLDENDGHLDRFVSAAE